MKKIIEYQKANSLTPDGVIGPKTAETLRLNLGILTIENLAHFLGQLHHECGFEVDVENLNYSAAGLLKTFPKYFKTKAMANLYARQPEKIANKVYANRMGNGDEASGDGWRFRGRGAIQLTGKNNFTAFAKFQMDPNILLNPSLVSTKYFWESAMFYFQRNNLFSICVIVNDLSIFTVSKAINGGVNGLADRVEKTNNYYNMLRKK